MSRRQKYPMYFFLPIELFESRYNFVSSFSFVVLSVVSSFCSFFSFANLLPLSFRPQYSGLRSLSCDQKPFQHLYSAPKCDSFYYFDRGMADIAFLFHAVVVFLIHSQSNICFCLFICLTDVRLMSVSCPHGLRDSLYILVDLLVSPKSPADFSLDCGHDFPWNSFVGPPSSLSYCSSKEIQGYMGRLF